METEVSARPTQESLDLRRPHAAFRFPELQPWPETPDETLRSLARMLWPQRPQCVRFFASTADVYAFVFKGVKRLALPRPAPADLLQWLHEQKINVQFLPNDPEEVMVFDFSGVEGVYWGSPNVVDGSYFHQGYLDSLLAEIRKGAPRLPILCDARVGLFSFAQVTPGSGERRLAQDPALYVFNSTHPLISPHNAELLWLKGGAMVSEHALPLAPEDLARTAALVTAFASRHGGWVEEFRRRMLIMERSLRLFADEIRPLTERGWLHVPLWPLAGYHLLIDARPLLAERGWSSAQLVAHLAAEGLLIENGADYAAPGFLRLCYASPLPVLRKAGRRLTKILLV